MAVCGMCHGSGFFGMDRCPCLAPAGKRPFFPKKKAARKQYDLLPAAKCRHGKIDEMLSDAKYLCVCGSVIKIDIA